MIYWSMNTIAGWVSAASSKRGLCAMTLPLPSQEESINYLKRLLAGSEPSFQPGCPDKGLADLENALNRFFNGEPEPFDFEVDWSVYTPFQQKILKTVQQIPYGSLMSYGQVAMLAGQSGAFRATGGALGSNRILMVIPCHRVIRGDGTIGGFGNNLNWKRELLAREGVLPGPGGRYPLCQL